MREGKMVTEEQFDTFGDKMPDKAVMEDVVCTIQHWGRVAEQDNEGRWYYHDVIWLRRMDDGTVEYAYPSEVMFLDVLNG